MTDHLTNLGLLSIGSRFKRLSDALYQEMASFYRDQGIDFDPGNFPLLHAIASQDSMSISALTEQLGISQAAVSQKVAALTKQGILKQMPSKTDKRKASLHLTANGHALVKKLEPCWGAIRKAIERELGTDGAILLTILERLENGIARGRLQKHLRQAFAMEQLRIVPYAKKYTPMFDRLNRAWIKQYFTVEPFDHQVLTQPKKMIIDQGGEVWFAEWQGNIVGTYALFTLKLGMLEFTKLGIDESARGLGIARSLLHHAAARAKARGAHTLRIFTSTRLVPACTLYRSEGFREVIMTATERKRYQRADIMFDLKL